ncbi:NAD(P)/FAD-dependent oxidoreductase [Hippea maritima]|uniref:FAD-dependent pyridine nucleotide-disulfide oxidoreductase n=1 Tax=Hippea maritima (strain ATCC 700847 / DSM 10411 / MH2) TaxID=760142 RepID=F2LVM1_HIPMA|nr:FAD-dependent oxidoreductase [Hippea maritima]AEA33805.1 FAD-dependent pyridine nucleotide-disulfide oxidoreductase [Hippea maritima DSM 10411]
MIAIIGGSIAAFYAYKTIKDIDKTIEVKVFSKEDRQPYAKMMLPYMLYNQTESSFEINPDDIVLNCEVKVIDTTSKTIKTHNYTYSFDKAIIAAGADAYIPEYKGDYDGGLFGVRYASDIKAIGEKLKKARFRHIVVLGAGLVSLEMAFAFVKLGFSVSVVVSSSRILSQILPDRAAKLVQNHIESLYPVKFYTSNDVEFMQKMDNGIYVKLKDGEELNSDFVVVGKGVRPNTHFIDKTVKINTGVIVDEFLKAKEDVFAAGDIAESEDAIWNDKRLHAIWPVAIAQAKIAAKNAVGLNIKAEPEISRNILPIFGIDIFTGGDSIGFDGDVVESESDGFRMVVIKDGLLRGFCMVGQVRNYGGLVRLVKDRTGIRKYELNYLLFGNV